MFSQATKESAANDMKQNVKNLENKASEAIRDTQTTLENTAHDAGRQLRQFVDTASAELQTATTTVKTQITDKPVQSTLIALAAGFVLGALFRR